MITYKCCCLYKALWKYLCICEQAFPITGLHKPREHSHLTVWNHRALCQKQNLSFRGWAPCLSLLWHILSPCFLKQGAYPFSVWIWRSAVFTCRVLTVRIELWLKSDPAHANETWPSGSWRQATEVLRLCSWCLSVLNRAVSYSDTRIWRTGFVWGFCLVNSNLFCGDFPAVFQRAGMWQHDVSSQSEASQNSSHDEGVFISHTYSGPTFSKLSWLFIPPKSVLYPLSLSRGKGNRI